MYDLPEVAADIDAVCGALAAILGARHERPADLMRLGQRMLDLDASVIAASLRTS